MSMKYIRVEQLGKSFDVIVIFPQFVGHDEMMDSMDLEKEDIVSAGFVRTEPPSKSGGKPEMVCYGHSESLDLQADKHDSRILNLQMFGKRKINNGH